VRKILGLVLVVLGGALWGLALIPLAGDATGAVPPAAEQGYPAVETTFPKAPLASKEALVPAGPFWMGCEPEDRHCDEDERPRRQVILSVFYMDLHEVTNNQYAAFLAASKPANRCAGHPCVLLAHPHQLGLVKAGERWGVAVGYENRPVVFVTWYGAAAFCKWSGRRLPTEAEWEKAAKGAKEHYIYPWGDAFQRNRANGWHSGHPYQKGRYPWTTPAGYFDGTDRGGSFPTADGRSPYGVHDLAGNVWEWVSDWYGEGYYARAPAQDPQGPAAGRYKSLRGGGWHRDLGDRGLHVLRTSDREEDVAPGVAGPDLGFRCARSAGMEGAAQGQGREQVAP